MKKFPLVSSLPWTLAVLAMAPLLRADDAPSAPVQMSPYEVTAPKYNSRLQELYFKLDSLFDGPWVDTGQSGALVEAIIWRHGYLHVHPREQAEIYIDRRGDRVTGATTVYTAGDRLYANSWALGEHVRLPGLTAADLHNEAKVRTLLHGIRDAYVLDSEFAINRLSFFPGRGSGIDRVAMDSPSFYYYSNSKLNGRFSTTGFGGGGYFLPPVLGEYTALPDEENLSAAQVAGLKQAKTGKPVIVDSERFYEPFLDVGWQIFAETGHVVYTGDAFHEAPGEMLDTIYRKLSDPAEAGQVPVGLGFIPINPPRGDGSPGRTQMVPVVTFDWEGVHYIYRPYHGTVASDIERNPVTNLPYLYVKDNGLMESIYFCATYPKTHPGEQAVLVPGVVPAAAFTAKGRVALFCPSLNYFGAPKNLPAEAIGQPERLSAAVGEMQAAAAKQPGRHRSRLVTGLRGDTPDAQMRRAFEAFDAAGLSPRLRSAPKNSSLTFTWQGVTYVYGEDQRLARLN